MPPKEKGPKKARSKEAQDHADALAKAGIKVRSNASEKSLRAMAKVLNANAPVDPTTGEKEELTYTNAEERADMKADGGLGTTANNNAGIKSYMKTPDRGSGSRAYEMTMLHVYTLARALTLAFRNENMETVRQIQRRIRDIYNSISDDEQDAENLRASVLQVEQDALRDGAELPPTVKKSVRDRTEEDFGIDPANRRDTIDLAEAQSILNDLFPEGSSTPMQAPAPPAGPTSAAAAPMAFPTPNTPAGQVAEQVFAAPPPPMTPAPQAPNAPPPYQTGLTPIIGSTDIGTLPVYQQIMAGPAAPPGLPPPAGPAAPQTPNAPPPYQTGLTPIIGSTDIGTLPVYQQIMAGPNAPPGLPPPTTVEPQSYPSPSGFPGQQRERESPVAYHGAAGQVQQARQRMRASARQAEDDVAQGNRHANPSRVAMLRDRVQRLTEELERLKAAGAEGEDTRAKAEQRAKEDAKEQAALAKDIAANKEAAAKAPKTPTPKPSPAAAQSPDTPQVPAEDDTQELPMMAARAQAQSEAPAPAPAEEEEEENEEDEERPDPGGGGGGPPDDPPPGGGGDDGGGGGGGGPGGFPGQGVPLGGGGAAARALVGAGVSAGAALISQRGGGAGGSVHAVSDFMNTIKPKERNFSTPYRTRNENMASGIVPKGATDFATTQVSNVYSYEQKLSDMEAEKRAAGAVSVGVGIKDDVPAPITHVDACFRLFRSEDYDELDQNYDKGTNLTDDAKRQFPGDKAAQTIRSVVANYGRALKINKPMTLQQGKDAQIKEALELQQLVKAYQVYRRITKGTYFANNTVESAIDTAVNAVLTGNNPGIYPYSSSQNGTMNHAKQPSESSKQPFQGKFKMPDAKRRKLNPFRPINYAI